MLNPMSKTNSSGAYSSMGKDKDSPQDCDAIIRQLPGLLLPWYWEHARDLQWRSDREPYHVWLSEIMLQQTRVDTVKEYYRRFLERYPTVADLACADEEQVIKLWEGLGYYSRARNLHKTALIIHNEYNGQFPSEIKLLRSLPGIGDYSSGAIASICFEQPTPAVDGNVLRIISRITEDYRSIDDSAYKKDIVARLAAVYPTTNRGDFTQSLMELGATICLPNGLPLCELCPAVKICKARQNDCITQLPVKNKKAARKNESRTALILYCNGKTAIRKRTEKGVLRGLWEFPNVGGSLSADEACRIAADLGTGATTVIHAVQGKHIFTHIEWNLQCYYLQCTQTPSIFEWVDAATLADIVALPTAFKKFWIPDYGSSGSPVCGSYL